MIISVLLAIVIDRRTSTTNHIGCHEIRQLFRFYRPFENVSGHKSYQPYRNAVYLILNVSIINIIFASLYSLFYSRSQFWIHKNSACGLINYSRHHVGIDQLIMCILIFPLCRLWLTAAWHGVASSSGAGGGAPRYTHTRVIGAVRTSRDCIAITCGVWYVHIHWGMQSMASSR